MPMHRNEMSDCGTDAVTAIEPCCMVRTQLYHNYVWQIKKYRANNEEMNEAKQKYEQSAEAVNNLTNNLSTISEELDDVKNQMDDRGSSMTDTSPVVKMKKALAQVPHTAMIE